MRRLAKIGLLLTLISIIGLVSLPLSFIAFEPFFYLGHSNSGDYDAWIEDASSGDEITVIGQIETEVDGSNQRFLHILNSYKLKGSNHYFNSERNIGMVGDWVEVRIEMNTTGPLLKDFTPHHKLRFPMIVYCCIWISLLLTGGFMTVQGFRRPHWKYDPDRLMKPL